MSAIFKVESPRAVIATTETKRTAKDIRDGYNKAFRLMAGEEYATVHRGPDHKRGESGRFRYPYMWSSMELGP